jgi:hypothetical protein
MGTNTKADRIQRFRDEYHEVRWDPTDANAARDTAMRVTIENALGAIADGDSPEAVAWSQIGQQISFRWRRVTT